MHLTTILLFANGIELINFSNHLLVQGKNIARLDVR
jgi:hypothetical protein